MLRAVENLISLVLGSARIALGVVSVVLALVAIVLPLPANLIALWLALLAVSVGALFGGRWFPISVLVLCIINLVVGPFTLAFLFGSGLGVVVMGLMLLAPIVAMILRGTGRVVLGGRVEQTIVQRARRAF